MKKLTSTNILIVFSFLGIILIFLPYLIAFLSTFKSVSEFSYVKQNFLPQEFILDNYINVFNQITFIESLINTILVSLISASIVTLISIFIGYLLAFVEFKFKKLLIALLFVQIIIPFETLILPWIEVTGKLGMYDTLFILTLPQIVSSFGILFMWRTFSLIPKNIIKSINIETTNHYEIIFKYVLPSSLTNIKILSLYVTLFCWESFIWPLLVNYSENKMTLTPLLVRFSSNYAANYPLFITASLIITLPYCIIGFVLLRNNIKVETDYI